VLYELGEARGSFDRLEALVADTELMSAHVQRRLLRRCGRTESKSSKFYSTNCFNTPSLADPRRPRDPSPANDRAVSIAVRSWSPRLPLSLVLYPSMRMRNYVGTEDKPAPLPCLKFCQLVRAKPSLPHSLARQPAASRRLRRQRCCSASRRYPTPSSIVLSRKNFGHSLSTVIASFTKLDRQWCRRRLCTLVPDCRSRVRLLYQVGPVERCSHSHVRRSHASSGQRLESPLPNKVLHLTPPAPPHRAGSIWRRRFASAVRGGRWRAVSTSRCTAGAAIISLPACRHCA